MSDPTNLLTHATELVEHGRTLQETGRKLGAIAEALRNDSTAWSDERARATEVQAQLATRLAQATRGISVDINVGFKTGHGTAHPRTSVNARVDYPASDAGHGNERVVEVIDD
jgi:hypothetical protein